MTRITFCLQVETLADTSVIYIMLIISNMHLYQEATDEKQMRIGILEAHKGRKKKIRI